MLRDLVERRGKTVVAVTHDLELAARMDRQVRLVDGGILGDVRTADLTSVVPA